MALLGMTRDYSASPGMKITFDVFNRAENLRTDQTDQKDIVYRVIQESITNAKRHGHAPKVKITISGNTWKSFDKNQ